MINVGLPNVLDHALSVPNSKGVLGIVIQNIKGPDVPLQVLRPRDLLFTLLVFCDPLVALRDLECSLEQPCLYFYPLTHLSVFFLRTCLIPKTL